MLKVVHCADLHLGLKFGKYPDETAQKLRDARFRTLEKLVAAGNAEGAQLFVVAGDLFDHLAVSKKEVQEAARLLAAFDGVVAVLPGNHDFLSGQEQDLWTTKFDLPEHGRMLLLAENRPYALQEFGLDVVLYPAPCRSKYSETHGLGWLEGLERPPGRYHLGIAHGSFEGLSPDLQGNYFPMTRADLQRHPMDLWLLGHIHVPFPVRPGPGDRIYYSGTHEPDGFDCRHDGQAWLLELNAQKEVTARALQLGSFRFQALELVLRSLAELESLGEKIPTEQAARTLLKLTLSGALRREEHARFGEALERLKPRFFFLKADFHQVGVELAPEDIDREFSRSTFPHRLLTELTADAEGREALQVAFELLQEARGQA
jgi:DNA repair protein SbcD/Mre11